MVLAKTFPKLNFVVEDRPQLASDAEPVRPSPLHIDSR